MSTVVPVALLEQVSHILVVEDDIPLASFMRQRLEAERYVVDLVDDGPVAAEALSNSKYDLVVLDLNLPTVDGITLLRQFRPTYPKMPVLVLTGRSRVEDRVLSLDAGADDCMNKPFSLQEFSARVRALLRRNYEPIEATLTIGDLTVDPRGYRVERAGGEYQPLFQRIQPSRVSSSQCASPSYSFRAHGKRMESDI